MKKILAALFLISAFAVNSRAGQEVTEVVYSTYTVQNVSISSFSATQVDSTARALAGRTFLTIQNMDATYKIYCKENNTVTTSTGFFVPANGGSVTLPIRYGTPTARITLYCITANTTASSTVALIQGK